MTKVQAQVIRNLQPKKSKGRVSKLTILQHSNNSKFFIKTLKKEKKNVNNIINDNKKALLQLLKSMQLSWLSLGKVSLRKRIKIEIKIRIV